MFNWMQRGRNWPTTSLWFTFSVSFLLHWTMCAKGKRAVFLPTQTYNGSTGLTSLKKEKKKKSKRHSDLSWSQNVVTWQICLF